MIIFRKILFYLFLALYLVVCPVIILYALGYIFTPKLEESLTKTGLIHVETIPSGALISLGKRHYAERTPAAIRNLLPGSYDLKISLRDHRPWIQKIQVDPGKAVNLEKILLVPRDIRTRPVASGAFEDLCPVPGTHYVLLKGGKHGGTLNIFDWKSGVLRPAFKEKTPLADARLAGIFTAKDSSFVVLQLESAGSVKFVGYQLGKEKEAFKDLTPLFQNKNVLEIQWEGAHPEYLFTLYGRDLSRLDLEKMNVTPDLLTGIRGFGLFRGRIYALRGDTVVKLGFGAKKGEETLVEKGVFLENLFRDTEKYKIDFISNRTICFYGEHGEFLSNVLPYHFVSAGVRGYEAWTEGRKILLWQAGRAGILDFEKPERKKEFFERGPEIDWIVENGRDIRQAYFVDESAYILFCDGDKIWISRSGEYRATPEEIVTLRAGTGMCYAERTGKLYYLEPAHGTLMAADILPEGLSLSGVINEFEKETQETMK